MIGAMHIPEKWFPGAVDMWLNSHNIMHILVVMAVYSMHQVNKSQSYTYFNLIKWILLFTQGHCFGYWMDGKWQMYRYHRTEQYYWNTYRTMTTLRFTKRINCQHVAVFVCDVSTLYINIIILLYIFIILNNINKEKV